MEKIIKIMSSICSWLEKNHRYRRLFWLGGLIAAILFFTYITVNPRDIKALNPVSCQFSTYTGLPCPLCGLTRGCRSLISGKISLGLKQHPASLPVIICFLLLALESFWRLKINQDGLMKGKISRALIYCALTIPLSILINWLFRLK
jgi:hypothetical protein